MTRGTDARSSSGHDGNALIVALLLTITLVGVVVSGSSMMKANQSRAETSFLVTGQAAEFARSGLIEAVNWFRRQPVQPVTVFEPVLDTSADPKILDTEDPDIGLMREFKITGRLWGRYEVWKRWDADPDPERLAWRNQVRVEDVSLKRQRNTAGNVWRIRSIGYIYDRRDPNVDFRSYPNRIVASETLEAEISRMSIALPGQAALCVRRGDNVSIKKNGRVLGGSVAAGIFYPQGTGSPSVHSQGEVTGVPGLSPSVVYDDSFEYVFGVGDSGLQAMADLYIEEEADFPCPLPPASLTVFDDPGTWLTFGSSRKLEGTGIVVIKGNVKMNAGSLSFFDGLLYIDGDLDMHAPFVMQGAFIVTGTISVQGIGDFGDLVYDDTTLGLVQQNLASYRISRPARRLIQE